MAASAAGVSVVPQPARATTAVAASATVMVFLRVRGRVAWGRVVSALVVLGLVVMSVRGSFRF
ncbi:hypothetical protein GCM10009617_07300 [Leifsonia poae]|uniref:Uncharacterized protein n=1 Tax=Leifsonia poae TaxID=110933 RepID=A0A9W6LYV7_9MICO|nr:hypothetical protein GCM10017584_08290 [Leifsonia poae]